MDLENLLHKKKDQLIYFSPFRFIRELDPASLVDTTVIAPLIQSLDEGSVEDITITENNQEHHFLVKKLKWDSAHFGFPNYKILNVLYEHSSFPVLSNAVSKFIKEFCTEADAYYYLDLPHEEILLIQAFTDNGFRMVENRMNLYYDRVQEYSAGERYPVRTASGEDDAHRLLQVAMEMRNPYDRFHADAQVEEGVADKYIGQFAYNSVMGYADFVLVPDLPDTAPFGFLTANKPDRIGDYNISSLGLAAIDNRNNERGWLYKLQSEILYLLKDHQVDYLTTITQTSNAPAYKTWEKLGFKLAFFTSILTYKNKSTVDGPQPTTNH